MPVNTKVKEALLGISAGMMELTWLYAIACILFLMMDYPIFPIWAAITAFFIPVMVTSFLKGRGKRIIEHVLLHLFFYLSTLLPVIYYYGKLQKPFWSFTWLKMILHQQYGSMDGFAYLLMVIWFSILWINGFKLANRSNDYFMVASRFDLGIVALIITFIILGSMSISFPHAGILIIYYFLFSMFAIALAKNLSSSKTSHSYQLSGTGLVVTFILVVLLVGSWVVLFFLPQLTSSAQTGYRILKIMVQPIGNLLLKILGFLFGYGHRAAGVSPTYPGESGIPLTENTELSWWGQLLKWIITWGGIIVSSLLALIAIGWLLWSLWKWFSTKTDLDSERKDFFKEFVLWIIYLFSLAKKGFYQMTGILKNIFRKPEDVSEFFQKLCRWGQSSGIPRERSDTPREYSRHLAHFFPGSRKDIQFIIDSFNQEVYGQKPIPAEQLEKIKEAWQHLSCPSHWPRRFLVKLFYSRKFNFHQATSSSFHS